MKKNIIFKLKKLFLLFSFIFILPVILKANSDKSNSKTKILLQFEDFDIPPWNFKNKTGLNFILFQILEKSFPNVVFEYRPVPWKRCFNEMKEGVSDGCFSASYNEERNEFGVYPKTDNVLDETKRLYSLSYNLYIHKDYLSVVSNEGLKINGLPEKAQISAPSGWSIEKDLKEQGYSLDMSSSDIETNFKKVSNKRIFGFAVLSAIGDEFLKTSKIKDVASLAKPLVSKNYYLMFSHQFVKKNSELAKNIWKKIEEIRESTEFKKLSKEYLLKMNPK